MSIDPTISYLLTVFAALAGGFIFGVAGIGLPVILVPTLSVLYDPRTAIVIASIPNLFSSLRLIVRGRPSREDIRSFWPLFPLSILGVLAGNRILTTVEPSVLIIGIAVVMLVFVGISLLPFDLYLSPVNGRRMAPVIGLTAGVLQGAVAISGAPLAIFFQSVRLPKHRFVAMMALAFIISAVMQIAALAGSSLYTTKTVALSLGSVVPMLIGMQIGVRVQDRIQQRTFNRCVLAVLFISACSLLFRVVGLLP